MAEVTEFGQTATGATVHRVLIRSHGMELSLLTHGARVHRFCADGSPNLVASMGSLSDYEKHGVFHNAIVAPVVNRLGNACWEENGRIHRFEPSEEGPFCLHSGSAGTQHKVWTIDDHGADFARFSVVLEDGDGGFPGQRRIVATYRLAQDKALGLEIKATGDVTTLFNIAFHGYWNLDGTDHWTGHILEVAASRYLPTGPDLLPTGSTAPVAGTKFDFRTARQPSRDLDHCLCLDSGSSPSAELTGTSGRRLAVTTDAPGLQVFCGLREAIALEAQDWPDALRHGDFPSIVYPPGVAFLQKTTLRITT